MQDIKKLSYLISLSRQKNFDQFFNQKLLFSYDQQIDQDYGLPLSVAVIC